MTQIKDDTDDNNICCPELEIAECEFDEHRHLFCGFSKATLSNSTIKEICIGYNFKNCVNMRIDAS